MMSSLLIAIRAAAVTLLLTAGIYPLVVTGLARVLFPDAARGSPAVTDEGRVVGSVWIGQPFLTPGYFQPRPSAAGSGYDGLHSGGSNLGPTSMKLRVRALAEQERLLRSNPDAPGPVPAELVTTSASGLDPHLSPLAAHWQVARVAGARHLSRERVEALVDSSVETATFGFLGDPRVNVLLLNLALDRQFGRNAGSDR